MTNMTMSAMILRTFHGEQPFDGRVSSVPGEIVYVNPPYPNILPRKNLSDSDLGYVCVSYRMWLNAFASSV